ncbi:MAG: hypothetical protein ACRDJE_27570 [Dehalococcoidia bacterium]
MSMATNIVEYTVSPEHAETLHGRVQERLVPAARQTQGYRGFLLLDRGEGTRLAVVLYDSAAAARAAQQTLVPVGMEITADLIQGPIQRTVGTVVISDGVFATTTTR